MGAGACRAPAVGERGAGAAAVHLPGGQGFCLGYEERPEQQMCMKKEK